VWYSRLHPKVVKLPFKEGVKVGYLSIIPVLWAAFYAPCLPGPSVWLVVLEVSCLCSNSLCPCCLCSVPRRSMPVLRTSTTT